MASVNGLAVRPAFRRQQPADRVFVQGAGRQAVDGFGGQRHQPPFGQGLHGAMHYVAPVFCVLQINHHRRHTLAQLSQTYPRTVTRSCSILVVISYSIYRCVRPSTGPGGRQRVLRPAPGIMGWKFERGMGILPIHHGQDGRATEHSQFSRLLASIARTGYAGGYWPTIVARCVSCFIAVPIEPSVSFLLPPWLPHPGLRPRRALRRGRWRRSGAGRGSPTAGCKSPGDGHRPATISSTSWI